MVRRDSTLQTVATSEDGRLVLGVYRLTSKVNLQWAHAERTERRLFWLLFGLVGLLCLIGPA